MSLSPTPEQLAAINTLDRNCIVTAGAGSGKTFVLVERFLKIIEEEAKTDANIVGKIVAITFTDKAANEMKQRVRTKCINRREISVAINNEEDVELWSNIILQLENANIATFHAYCTKLLRLHPIEAGLDPRFEVMEGTESKRVIYHVIEKIVKNALVTHNKANGGELFHWVTVVGFKKAVSNLVEIYEKICNHITELDEAVKLTEDSFNEGFSEVLSAIPQLIGLADTLYNVEGDSNKMTEFREFWGEVRINIDFSAIDPADFASLVTVLVAKSSGNFYLDAAKSARQELNTYTKQLAEFVNAFVSYQQQEQNLTSEILRVIREIDLAYKKEKNELNKLDFNDLILRVIHLLRGSDEIRAKVRTGIAYLMVDEFQDSNQIQKELIDLLLIDEHGQIKSGGLFIVGDPKQSIYRFRGADVSIFKEMEKQLASHGGSILPMKINFRSQPEVIDFVNHFFARIMSPDANSPNYYEEAEYGRKELGVGRIEYIPVFDVKNGADIEEEDVDADLLAEYKLQEREAMLIAARIKEFVDHGIEPKEITILFQAMTNIRLYEQALRIVDVPFYTVGGRGFFAKQEIYDLLNILNYLDDQSNQIALAGILRSPLVAITDETLYLLAKKGLLHKPLSSWDHELASLPVDEISKLNFISKIFTLWAAEWSGTSIIEQLDFWVNRTNFKAILLANEDGIQKVANINKFRRIVSELSADNPFSTYLLLKRIERIISDEEKITEAAISSEADNAVRLMNIHQSKGLEFPYVFIPNLSRKPVSEQSIIRYDLKKGLSCKVPLPNGEFGVPLRWLLVREQERLLEREESIRLFYVAATRAINGLILSGKFEEEMNEEQTNDSSIWSKWFGTIFDFSKSRNNTLPYTTKGRTREIQVFTKEINLDLLNTERKELVDITKIVEAAITEAQIDVTNESTECGYLKKINTENSSRIFNITAINRYLKCPRFYYYFDVRKINRIFPSFLTKVEIDDKREIVDDDLTNISLEQRLSPQLKGIIVHNLMERITLDPTNLMCWEKLFDEQLAEIVLEDTAEAIAETATFKEEVGAFISNYATNPLAQSNANEILAELEFILQLANGKVYGLIDRIELTDDSFTIIDYKTDQVIQVEQYAAQIKTYALAMLKNLKKEAQGGFLYYIRHNRLEEITVDKDTLLRWETELEGILFEINQAINSNNYTKKLEQCSNCEFAKLCAND